MGIEREATSSRAMLTATDARKASVQNTFRNPSTKRSEVVNPISKQPPTISHSQGMTFLSLDEPRRLITLPSMAKPGTIGNKIAQPRFLAFIAVLIVGVPLGHQLLGNWALGAMAGFDVASVVF